MRVEFSSQAMDDLAHWRSTDRTVLARISRLLDDVADGPFEGIGKPERLRGDLTGYWSRRINREHRLVYAVDPDRIFVLQARGHYDD